MNDNTAENEGISEEQTNNENQVVDVTSKEQLRDFLLNIRDKMADQTAPPIYAFTAINRVMNLPGIYDFLDKENKELARDVWLRLKQAGFSVSNPPMLFSEEEN